MLTPPPPPPPNKINEILNHFLLAGEKFKPNLGLQIQAFVDHLLKTEYKNSKKKDIQDMFIKTNLTEAAFSMI